MAEIRNKFFIGGEYWYKGFKDVPTKGIIGMIYGVHSSIRTSEHILSYEFEGVNFNFREDQIFLTKEEAERGGD